MQICWGAIDHGRGNPIGNSPPQKQKHSVFLLGYDLSNQTTYLDDMLRWSLEWLIKVRFCFLGRVQW